MGPYCVILEYDAKTAALRRNVFTAFIVSYYGFIDNNFTCIGYFVTGNEADEDGFAAA